MHEDNPSELFFSKEDIEEIAAYSTKTTNVIIKSLEHIPKDLLEVLDQNHELFSGYLFENKKDFDTNTGTEANGQEVRPPKDVGPCEGCLMELESAAIVIRKGLEDFFPLEQALNIHEKVTETIECDRRELKKIYISNFCSPSEVKKVADKFDTMPADCSFFDLRNDSKLRKYIGEITALKNPELIQDDHTISRAIERIISEGLLFFISGRENFSLASVAFASYFLGMFSTLISFCEKKKIEKLSKSIYSFEACRHKKDSEENKQKKEKYQQLAQDAIGAWDAGCQLQHHQMAKLLIVYAESNLDIKTLKSYLLHCAPNELVGGQKTLSQKTCPCEIKPGCPIAKNMPEGETVDLTMTTS